MAQRNIARTNLGVKLIDEENLSIKMSFAEFKKMSIPEKMSLLDFVFEPILPKDAGVNSKKLREVIAPMAKHFCSNWEEYTSNTELREDTSRPAAGNIPSSVLIIDTLTQNVEVLQDDITKTMASMFEDNPEMDKNNQEKRRLNYAWR